MQLPRTWLTYECWPFTQGIDTLDELRDTDIEKDLMEIGGCAVEAEPEAETEVEAEAEPELKQVSDAYEVPSAIASAANVLLEAATNGERKRLASVARRASNTTQEAELRCCSRSCC